MNPGDHELFGRQTPLVYCPQCEERLEYTVDRAAANKDVVLDRACTGCDYCDTVVTSSLSVAIWYRRETRILAELRPLVVFLVETSDAENALVAARLQEVSNA
jgi:MinD superfamily P-loop ATPase